MSVFSEHQIRMMRASAIDERREAAKKRHKLALRIFPACMVGLYVGTLSEFVAVSAFVIVGMAWVWFGLRGET